MLEPNVIYNKLKINFEFKAESKDQFTSLYKKIKTGSQTFLYINNFAKHLMINKIQ